MSGIQPSMVHPILYHVNRIRLVHNHLYQVPFILYRPCRYVLDEKEITLWYFNITLICISALWSTYLILLGSWVDMIPLPPITGHPGSTGIWLFFQLKHHLWSHYQDMHLDISMTLVRITTCCIQPLLGRTLLWLLQAIYPEGCSPMVLTWWLIWCLPHINYFGAPEWIVYLPSWNLIPSFFFWASLGTHKKANSESNMILVQDSPGLCRVTLFWILVSGLPHYLFYNVPDSFTTQYLKCQTNSKYLLCCSSSCA